MKPLYRGLLTILLTALLLAGCAGQQQSPSVVDRTPPNAEYLLNQAEQQAPEQAVRTRLEAAFIFARQGQQTLAFETAGGIDEMLLPMQDRIRWALLYSEMAQAANQPDEVLRATAILDAEPGMPAEQLQTLQERKRWALSSSNQFNAERFGLVDIGEVQHIGVFLPQSGALGNIASIISDAIQTHHNLQGNAIQLSFFDTTSTSMSVLYTQARQQGIEFVIGPLSKQEVTSMEVQESVPLPTLALNYGQNDRNQAQKLLQFGLSAEDEARQVAKRAWADGHREMAVLVPDNDWGRRVGEAFWDTWSDAGGEVTNAISYAPEDPVSNAVKSALNVRGDRAQLDGIDALFLLALPEYARQVPPTLDYYYAADLPVYATSHLHEGTLQPRLNQDLDDVMFVDIPWQIPDAAVGGEEVLPHYASYRTLRDEGEMSMFRLMAMGVDAYEIASGIGHFIESGQIAGATGQLSLNSDGRIYRELPWAKFQNGIPSPILVPDFSIDDES